jgi:sulfite exporter TauE/SafE
MDSGLFGALYAFCTTNPQMLWLGGVLATAGLPAVLFLVGLFGGAMHCTGMCGPFVLAQVSGNRALMSQPGLSEWRRLRGATLLPYHLGRLTTYSALGGIAGALGGLVVGLSGYHWILAVLLGLAALLFLLQGLGALAEWLGNPLGMALTGPLTRLTRPLLDDPRGWRGYALGVALGFLPCGFLYGALTAAAGSGGAGQGALAMAAFTLGTVPNLVLVGYVGVFFGRRAGTLARAFSIPLMLINAGFLGFLALRAIG